MNKKILHEHNGHKCVHLVSALPALGLKADQDGRVANLLRGLIRPEGWEETCIRPTLLAQVMMERAGGALMNGNRGPKGRYEMCTCSDTPNPLWCPSLTRLRLLGDLVSGSPNRHPSAYREAVLRSYPGSCLAKIECFEIAVIRSVQSGRLKLENDALRPLATEETGELHWQISHRPAAERRRVYPQPLLPQTYF